MVLTFPIIGMSTEPQVSAPQCTIPEAKSAVTIPVTLRERKKKRRKNGVEFGDHDMAKRAKLSLQIMTAELY